MKIFEDSGSFFISVIGKAKKGVIKIKEDKKIKLYRKG
jgi:hypothetical protein